MIYAFTGRTGSGKTFLMVRQAFSAWLSGVDIYSNTALFFDNQFTIIEKFLLFFKKLFSKLNPSYEVTYPVRGKIVYFRDIDEITHVQNGIILFDEAQVLFSSRQWDSLSYEFQYKLQQHRKHNLDMYCTTQSILSIDVTYRRLVQSWFYQRCRFRLGSFGVYTSEYKDVEFLYRDNVEQTVPTLSKRWFIISKLSRYLYDTNFDIGFKKLKTVWYISPLTKKKEIYMIDRGKTMSDATKIRSILR